MSERLARVAPRSGARSRWRRCSAVLGRLRLEQRGDNKRLASCGPLFFPGYPDDYAIWLAAKSQLTRSRNVSTYFGRALR